MAITTTNYNTAKDKKDEVVSRTYGEGGGVGSKSNIERLAEDYVNSNYESFTQGSDYESLAKRYSDQGRKAMDDTVGQVAARTGGLASSYATTASQQAYGDWMGKLEDAARSLYDSQMAEKASKLGVAQNMYDREYKEWNDQRKFDYDAAQDNITDAKYEDSVIDANNEQILNDYTNDVYADMSLASDEDLASMTYDEYIKEYPAPKGFDKRDFELLKQQVMASKAASEDEEFTRYIYTGTQDDLGNNVFMYGEGGKTFSFGQGVNPYTGSINPDVKNGTWSNGYQPNNINGEKLSKTGITDVINGVTQNVWQTPDGSKWIWDGTQNKYLMYED